MTTPSITVHALTKKFGSFVAVDDVGYEVEPGEVVGLLGANGAGKTTNIRMIAGLLTPTSGYALITGELPNRAVRRRLGYVPQGLGLYRDLTIAQNLAFTANSFGVEPSRPTGPLATFADRLVGKISLGVQRQLAFECALQHAPDVLILDEPTSGVEPLGAVRLWDRIRCEAERGVGVLVSTHSMQEAGQCDRLLMMAAGRIVAAGTQTEIIGNASALQVTTDAWAEAFQALTAANILVTLDGRTIRAVDADTAAISAALDIAHIDATLKEVPSTLEERMASIATATTR